MNEIIDEFETVCFGDERVNTRSKKVIQSMYEGIGKSFSASFGGRSEIKAAYRLFDNNLVNPDKILDPHYMKTLERIKEQKIVVLAQDTTDIDMKHMECVENLGVLNDTKRPGCSLHPVIAFTPDKLCLGIIDAKFMIRPAEGLGKKQQNNSREIEDKESYRWIQGYQVACEVAEQCPETLCISVGDRESDIYELLLEATKGKADLVARAWHDRMISLPPSEKEQELLHENLQLYNEVKRLVEINKKIKNKKTSYDNRKENSALIKELKKRIKENKSAIQKEISEMHRFKQQLSLSPIVGTVEFMLSEGRGRKSRLVKQTIRAAEVTLEPSEHKKTLPEITINAILLEETDPPEGEEAVSWMFITTLPINTIEEIQFIIKVYLSRWGIELFFKVLKSGCKIEELRYQEASRLLACISVYMIVAWRILFATYIGRECPDLSCSTLFEISEWQSVCAVVLKKQPPEEAPPLGEFMKMIATLGGHRGRKGDGPPGIKVIWTGIQAMHKLAEGWEAFREFGQTK